MTVQYEVGEKVPVLDAGYVRLLDIMSSDEDIANAARVSYDSESYSTEKNRQLLRYLMRNRHTSPFEMAELKFEIRLPIFVMRQWVRHRTANLNEVSGRYVQLPSDAHLPNGEDLAPQATDNKQGREGGYAPHEITYMRRKIRDANRASYDTYEDLIAEYGLANELARSVLPVSTYTKIIWKIDLHNLFHFLKLRTDKHAQKEIRAYADVIENFVEEHFPICHKAWVDYSKYAYPCSRQEVDILRKLLYFYMYERSSLNDEEAQKRLDGIDTSAAALLNKRELAEFKAKFLE